MANYDNSMEYWEYRFQQSCRNELGNHWITYRVQYDFDGTEALKELINKIIIRLSSLLKNNLKNWSVPMLRSIKSREGSKIGKSESTAAGD